MSQYQKGKTNLDFTEARDSEWQWHQLGHMQVCTSLQTDNHASTPPLSFLQPGCPSCCPTNSVKALKATACSSSSYKKASGDNWHRFYTEKQQTNIAKTRNGTTEDKCYRLLQAICPSSHHISVKALKETQSTDQWPGLILSLSVTGLLIAESLLPHIHLFNGPFSHTTQVRQYQKGKTNLDFTEARDSEWQ